MRMSFKYKFILSFVVIEVIFISLIVFFNFSSLNNISSSLIDEKIETGSKLFTEMVKTPLAVYDLATIDDAARSFLNIKNVEQIKIFDAQDRVVSYFHKQSYNYYHIFDNGNKNVEIDERHFMLKVLPIELEGEVLGHVNIVFEITDSLDTKENNRNLTLLLVLLEILISAIIAYIIGVKLTNALSVLTLSAEKIAKNDQVVIPNLGKEGDEISVLANAFQIMQERITKRNKNLTKERDFYNALLDNASSIILVMNTKGEIVLSNKIVKKLTGYTQEELLGRLPWEMFLPKEIQEDVKSVFLSLVAGDFPSSYENVWIVKDGSHVPFAWSNSCIVDEKGEIEYVITVGVDITERRKTEQTIRALLNSPADSIVLISVDETILEINDIAATRLGKSVDELKGKKLLDYFSEEISSLRREYFNKLVKDKKPITFEESYRGYISKNYLYPIFNSDNEVMEISIFSHDVTLQRKAQKELKKYITLVDENVFISHTDTEGIITSVSKAFCRVTGYSSEELIGKKHNILKDSKTPNSLYKKMWNTIKSGKVWHGEIKNIAKDGSSFWMEVSIHPDFDDRKNIIGYYAIRQDITNKKLIEKLSITDTLTKLYNRRYFNDIFYREIHKAKRDKKIFCLLSLDVDNFKMYNDTYGHQMGDDTLFVIADSLKKSMKRSTDIAFRMGGEEFSAIYVVEDKKDVFDFAEKIRKLVEDKKIEHKTNSASKYITVSIGVACVDFGENQDAVTDKDILYRYSDEQLYKAKESGRNRVIVKEY